MSVPAAYPYSYAAVPSYGAPPYYPPSSGSYEAGPYNQPVVPPGGRVLQPRPSYTAPPKQSNALFIKNLPYDLTPDEFNSIFSQFGEIATTFINTISKRGIAFVTYYDIRNAIKAVEGLKDFTAHGRKPQVNYSYKPPSYSGLDPRETCPRILLTPAHPAHRVSEDAVRQSLSKFGDINRVTETNQNQIYVEYFDFRSTKKVMNSANNIEIDGEKYIPEVSVEKDEGVVYIMPDSPHFAPSTSKFKQPYPPAPHYPAPTYPAPAPVPPYVAPAIPIHPAVPAYNYVPPAPQPPVNKIYQPPVAPPAAPQPAKPVQDSLTALSRLQTYLKPVDN